MKFTALFLRSSLLLTVVALMILAFSGIPAQAQSKPDNAAAVATAPAQSPAVPARITQAIDETQLVRLRGNVHPLARPEFDQGAVADSQSLDRMLLLLQRSPEQETTLQNLMEEQHTPGSSNFHNWLTPDQFGKQFGPADADIQAVTDWLTRQGFQGIKVSAGRVAIEFSGNAGQVRKAFHTEIHNLNVNGIAHIANMSEQQIPAGLAPVVDGVVSLHNFRKQSHAHVLGNFQRDKSTGQIMPLFTYQGGAAAVFGVGPADFAKIYNVPPTATGAGQSIAIVGRTDIFAQDVSDFRSMFGLSANPVQIVYNGPNPGHVAGDEFESDLDVEWTGAVAQSANIIFVSSESTTTSDGVDLSALYIVDNNTAPILSESYGSCEAGTNNTFFNALWQQAAAQGISVFVSSGDNGSAACDSPSVAAAVNGVAVSGLASTPYNVAVGGTDFDDAGTQPTYWVTTPTTTTPPIPSSAISYIHEIPWNNSCARGATVGSVAGCTAPVAGSDVVAASGGSSTIYLGAQKPVWQAGVGDANRDLPDVSLFASNGPSSRSFYIICSSDSLAAPIGCNLATLTFQGVGGTSASAPAFAGVLGLVNENQATLAVPAPRQGSPNYMFYGLSKTAANVCDSTALSSAQLMANTCVFYDTTKGNISVACQGNSPNCSNNTAGGFGVMTTTKGGTTPAYMTGAGYDMATGLGSVNVANLLTAWKTRAAALTGSIASLKLNGATTTLTITHGQSVTAAVTVAPASGTTTPTGIVSIVAPTAVNGGISTGTLASGTVSFPTSSLPGGTYSVTADYPGDGTFAASTSNLVPVVVNRESSRLQIGIVTFSPANTNATTFAYGSPYILRMDILNSTANACQPLINGVISGCAFDATGVVTVTNNGAALDGGTFKVSSLGNAEDQPIQLAGGLHTISATYSGDISYSPPLTAVTDMVTVTAAATTTALGVSPTSSVMTNTPVTLTATITSGSNSSIGPSGTVTFLNGTATIGTATVAGVGATTVGASGTASLTQTLAAGTYSITARYDTDGNYATSSSAATSLTVASVGSFTVSYNPNPVILSSATGANAPTTVTVTPSGGFTGAVTVVCPAAANLPAGVTCTAPATITVTSGAATGTLTLAVAATSTTLSASAKPLGPDLYAAGVAPSTGGRGWWGLSAISGLGAAILLFLPGRKRYRAALGLGLVCVLAFTIGCSSSYGGGGGGGGAVATVTKIAVTAPANVALGGTFAVTATVTGGTPAGQVQLYDTVHGSTTAIGTPVTVSGGTAALTTPVLALGTHSISAHYLGDTYTLASQSGTVNVTEAGGPTPIAITTNPVATPAAPALNITIQ